MPDLTLMVVHAHPDDEAISTGGILAKYSAEGVRTVLVVCTDGGCGDGPGGVKPGDAGHDRAAVVAERRAELARSCEVLGVSALESLGYRDSGMMGWPDNDLPGSFWTTPLDGPARRLATLMEGYRPQVVVTYDANGFYGHPDHIQAHRVTTEAARTTGIPAKLYHTAVPRSRMAEFVRRARELGVEGFEEEGPGDEPAAGAVEAGAGRAEEAGVGASPERAGGPRAPREEWGTPDELVTTYVDVSSVTDRKFDSLLAHASQSENIIFLQMGRDLFREAMGWETFVRAYDCTGAELPESDLFAGLR